MKRLRPSLGLLLALPIAAVAGARWVPLGPRTLTEAERLEALWFGPPVRSAWFEPGHRRTTGVVYYDTSGASVTSWQGFLCQRHR